MRLSAVFLIMLYAACTGKTDSSCHSYYFPMQPLLAGRTYFFVNRNDTAEKTAWQMKATIVNKDTIFETRIINNGNLAEMITERVLNGRTVMNM